MINKINIKKFYLLTIKMGDFKKHMQLAQEKLRAVVTSFNKGDMSVVGDLSTKVIEQIIEADASKQNKHFGSHTERHSFSNEEYPQEINILMKKIWFAYGGLGYDGGNGNTAKSIVKKLNKVLDFFEKRLGVKIGPRAIIN